MRTTDITRTITTGSPPDGTKQFTQVLRAHKTSGSKISKRHNGQQLDAIAQLHYGQLKWILRMALDTVLATYCQCTRALAFPNGKVALERGWF